MSIAHVAAAEDLVAAFATFFTASVRVAAIVTAVPPGGNSAGGGGGTATNSGSGAVHEAGAEDLVAAFAAFFTASTAANVMAAPLSGNAAG